MKNLYINIFDNELTWKALIDDVASLTHKTSWHEIVNSEMKISKTAQNVEEIQTGRIITVNNQNDKALIVEDMTTSLDDNYWTITLIPLKGMLNYRICHPTDYPGETARKQSEIMMILPYNNLVSQTRDTDRKFWNAARTKNMFGVTGIKAYGKTIDFTIDWTTGYMGDCIIDLAKMYDVGAYPIGWNVYIDPTGQYFYMDTYQGKNKTIHQTTNNPVVFSEDYGNIKNADYTYSIKDWRNVAYMKWNNGTSDQNTPVGNTTYGATVSFNRKEIIIDSSKKTSNEVVNEGYSELNKRPHVESFTAEIIDNEQTMSTYNKDWILGDIVTIQSRSIKKNEIISVDAQITEIEEVYDNGEYTLNATFGEGKLSFIDLVKQSLKQK